MTRDEETGEVSIVINITPQPTPRPRVAKFGTYYPATYKAYIKELDAMIPPAAVALEGELLVEVEAVCQPIKKSKFTTPAGDVDNLAKGVLDMLTKKGFYGDDRQIVDLHVTKRFPRDDEQPHFRISLLEIE
ncbi:RusA family crossover junction endodeoxyribonuclease [Caldimonas thermodepolymerans]|uniref:RusA family crossover junction endodeoxyribonuclease n=1 Tax=Caldimonas thermodepolymerans TaxID=215580 RepID=UPI000E2BC788|nr:RusA family crossover junction endodeoxyribonuclease [Caldimonas thermodepolymerans]RDI02932.1 Holliday junction resolvase RusA-like endonuclease [Caldimonas thermodepolymerans]